MRRIAWRAGRAKALGPGRTPRNCISSANISVPTTDAALFRVTVDSISPKAATPASGERVDREARGEQPEPMAGRDLRPRERGERVKAPGDTAGHEPDEAHGEHDGERVA